MGLIGGMARTAVVAGTATAVSNRVSRRQAGRWAQQDAPQQQQQPPPQQQYAPAYQEEPPAGEDRLEQLQKLGELKAAGVLTEQEFQAEKARLLNG
jgi:Short C-terminal domain